MLVYSQNGERLRPQQGYPLRLLLPGFEGNMNVKWLRRLHVTAEPAYSREETSKYTDLLPDGDRSTHAILGIEAGGRELVWHQVWRRPSPERLTLACELGERLVCQSTQVP